MKHTNEDRLFDLIDQLNHNNVIDPLKDVPIHESQNIPKHTLNRIKKDTFKKIGIPPVKRKRWRKAWGSVAASFFLLAAGTAAVGPELVWAKIQDTLQFIPGLNIVMESREGSAERYILPKPVETSLDNGTLTVEGVVVDSERTILSLSGESVPQLRNVTLRDRTGATFHSDAYSIASGTHEWKGTYAYEETMPVPEELQIVLPADTGEKTIPISLQKAENYANYADMGPTDTVNGISVTAIPSLIDHELKVNFVSPPKTGMKIMAYADYPREENQTVELTDQENNTYDLSAPNVFSEPLGEFYFDITDSKSSEFTLTIPFITVVKEDEQRIMLDIPTEGTKNLHQAVSLGGYPIDFEKIERVSDDKIRIYVDVHFDPHADESLQSFSLDALKLPIPGWGSKANENGAWEYIDLGIRSNMKDITLHLQQPKIIKRGPWTFDIEF